jgi:hypothetical protein
MDRPWACLCRGNRSRPNLNAQFIAGSIPRQYHTSGWLIGVLNEDNFSRGCPARRQPFSWRRASNAERHTHRPKQCRKRRLRVRSRLARHPLGRLQAEQMASSASPGGLLRRSAATLGLGRTASWLGSPKVARRASLAGRRSGLARRRPRLAWSVLKSPPIAAGFDDLIPGSAGKCDGRAEYRSDLACPARIVHGGGSQELRQGSLRSITF